MNNGKRYILVKVACATPVGLDYAVLRLVANGRNHFSSFFHDNIRKWWQHSGIGYVVANTE